MIAWIARASDGTYLGRLIARSEEEALKDACEIWRRTDLTVKEVSS
jgi:hypothetical protein